MATHAASLETIEDFLAQKRIALVGISRDPASDSAKLFEELLRRGYDIVPVNPNTAEVQGHRCFARVQDIQPPVEAALLMTTPEATETVARDCAEARIHQVWMYRGIGTGAVSPDAVGFCHEQGIEVIAGECPYMFLPHTAAVHRLHGFIRKITALYPRRAHAAKQKCA